MSFFSRLFAKPQPASKDIAKERLRVVLIHDRADVSPELLQTLKQEMLAVISEHVIIDDEEGIEVTVSQTRGRSRLEVNIPLLGMRRQPLASTRQSSLRPKR
jgi:cell division topological specificity factor